MESKENIETQEHGQSSGAVGYKPPFSNVVCEVHSIDFEERTISLCVPKRIMEYGIHAGSLTIDFRPITE